MTKETFLTRRWNNYINLIMGAIAAGFAVFFLSTSVLSDFTGFITLALIGVVY